MRCRAKTFRLDQASEPPMNYRARRGTHISLKEKVRL